MALTLGFSVSTPAQTAELEVNTASQAQLESLPGVGPALSERLLKARVKGIGPATARKLSEADLRVQGTACMSDTTQSR